MSYSATMVVIECDARMKAIDVGKARRLLKNAKTYIESCFLDDMMVTADALLDEGALSAYVCIDKKRCWFSGNHVNPDSLRPLLPLIDGRISGYFVGEDGSLYGGFVIDGGGLQECEVTVTLKPKGLDMTIPTEQ